MLPGDYMVTSTPGFVGWCIRKLTHSTVNHAAVYIGGGQIVEAQPSGAAVSPVSKYPRAVWSENQLTEPQRFRVVYYAEKAEHTPYNFLDIAAQAVVRLFGWHAPAFVLRRLARPDRLQCAQLVDLAYEEAGVKLFKDGRPFGLIAPSDLLDLIKAAALKLPKPTSSLPGDEQVASTPDLANRTELANPEAQMDHSASIVGRYFPPGTIIKDVH